MFKYITITSGFWL